MEKLEISAIIPAYNEEGAIARVVQELDKTLRRCASKHEILVIDDGSKDKTAALAAGAGAKTLRHPINRGYGRALVTGFEAAKYDWLLMIDSDGSYPASEAEKLLAAAEGFDLVIGQRQGDNYWGTPWQALLRSIYLRIAGFVAGERIPDANSGLRLLKKSAYQHSMPFLCLGYSFTTTMTLSFLQSGLFVNYVPIRFAERTGRSKVKPVRDILRTLQIMTQMILYYNPLKLAVAASAVLAAGAAAAPLLLCCRHPRAGLAVGLTLGSLAVFVFSVGCLLDAIRLHAHARTGTNRL